MASIQEFERVQTTLRSSVVSVPVDDGAMDVVIMVQLFTDRVWVSVAESCGKPLRPGSVAVSSGSEGPLTTSDFFSTPDDLEVVLGPRDDPLGNVLTNAMYHVLAQAVPDRPVCLCCSTRSLSRALGSPQSRKATIDAILNALMPLISP